jgi:hypothetical protein
MKEVSVIPFFEKTWFFWWAIATVVILRWLHVISCNPSQEALEERDAADEDGSSDAGAVAARKRTPPRFGSGHAY